MQGGPVDTSGDGRTDALIAESLKARKEAGTATADMDESLYDDIEDDADDGEGDAGADDDGDDQEKDDGQREQA